MSMERPLRGRCVCGAVGYSLSASPLAVAACHCTQCRRQSGAAFSVNLIVRASTMEVFGDLVAWEDQDTESGVPLLREHCGVCGSPIRSVSTGDGRLIAVKAGTLDDPAAFAPTLHIWVRSKLPWVTVPRDLPAFERGAQP